MNNVSTAPWYPARLSEIADIRAAYAGQLFPAQQIHTFRHMRFAFPTRLIKAYSAPSSLPESPADFSALRIPSNGGYHDIYDYVSRNRIAGLLVLKNNSVLFEHYDFGQTADDLWMSMSMAKSISTTLVGIAIKQGYINGLDDSLVEYLPELLGTSYEPVSIRQLLLMTSGVQWNEDHTNPESERRAVLELQVAQQAGAILNYMSQLPRLHPPGEHWNYSTGETHLVGELLHAATGQWLSDYLSEQLWQPLGMQRDAYWWLESDGGLEIAGSGINASLRDYARFGLFMLNKGVVDGVSLLPDNWCDIASGPSRIKGQQIAYGFMWWPIADSDGSFNQGAYCARGIFGQRIYINPAKQLVVAMICARSKPMGDDTILDNDFFNTVSKYTE